MFGMTQEDFDNLKDFSEMSDEEQDKIFDKAEVLCQLSAEDRAKVFREMIKKNFEKSQNSS